MNECEWKDGKFEPCEIMNDRFISEKMKMKIASYAKSSFISDGYNAFNYCPFCGADIRKLEEKPLIVKSGGSLEFPGYVAFWEGVDYLWTGDKLQFKPSFSSSDLKEASGSYWKSFTGENPDITELTDELALLRPMCVYCEKSNRLWKLIAVLETCFLVSGIATHMTTKIDDTRLATAHELQEVTL